MTAPLLIEDGYYVEESVLPPRPGFLRRLVAAVAAWWRG
jgi:hypothetical protein